MAIYSNLWLAVQKNKQNENISLTLLYAHNHKLFLKWTILKFHIQ